MEAKAPSKEMMTQYSDMKEEIKQMKVDIQQTEDSIAKLIEEGTVCDKVTGGLGGIQGFKIEGFPVAEFEKRKRLVLPTDTPYLFASAEYSWKKEVLNNLLKEE